MIKKIIPLLLLTIIPLHATTNPFNFAQELDKTNTITKPIELIEAYQKIVRQITPDDSTRLAKKLLRKIRILHKIFHESTDRHINAAFKNLVKFANANEKMLSVDYTKDLNAIHMVYHGEEPEQLHPTTELEQKKPTESTTKPAPVEKKPEPVDPRKIRLREKTKDCDRCEVINLLLFKKLINQIDMLKGEISMLQKNVSHLTKQDITAKETYRKLLKLEQFIKRSIQHPQPQQTAIAHDSQNFVHDTMLEDVLDGQFEGISLIRSVFIEQPDERLSPEFAEVLEEYRPLLKKIVLAELDDPSSPFFH